MAEVAEVADVPMPEETEEVAQDQNGDENTEAVAENTEEQAEATETKNGGFDGLDEDENQEKLDLSSLKKATGTYVVEVSGLPDVYTHNEIKILLVNKFKFNYFLVKSVKKNSPWIYVIFKTEEDQKRAASCMNGCKWKKRKLRAEIVRQTQKKKWEGGANSKSAKRAKLIEEATMAPEERLEKVMLPLSDIPYIHQVFKKTHDVQGLFKHVANMMLKSNLGLAGWLEEQREKHEDRACEVQETKACPTFEGYVNKTECKIGINPETLEKTVGFSLSAYGEGSIGVAPVDCLRHLPERMKEGIKAFEDFVRQSEREPLTESNEGHWRMVRIRSTRTGELMFEIMVHPQSLTDEELDKLADEVKDYFESGEGQALNLSSLYLRWHGPKKDPRRQLPPKHILGKERVEETILDLKLHLKMDSIFPLNTLSTEIQYSIINDLLTDINEDTTVLDLFCGCGGKGLSVAKKCGQLLGIDPQASAIEEAQMNAAANGITNCEFFEGEPDEILETVLAAVTGKTVVVIVEPPRFAKGLKPKLISKLRKAELIQKMVFVSDRPRPEVKDYTNLAAADTEATHPFIPIKAIPLDMSPHTGALSLVLYFEKRDPDTLPNAKKPIPAHLLWWTKKDRERESDSEEEKERPKKRRRDRDRDQDRSRNKGGFRGSRPPFRGRGGGGFRGGRSTRGGFGGGPSYYDEGNDYYPRGGGFRGGFNDFGRGGRFSDDYGTGFGSRSFYEVSNPSYSDGPRNMNDNWGNAGMYSGGGGRGRGGTNSYWVREGGTGGNW